MSHPFPQALPNEHLHRFEESLQLQTLVLKLVVVYFFPAPLQDVCTYLAYFAPQINRDNNGDVSCSTPS
jgi:hypothetical protein